MSLTIELSPEQQNKLHDMAKQAGATDEEVASMMLGAMLNGSAPEITSEPPSDDSDLPECWRGYVGVVDSGGSMAARDAKRLWGEAHWQEHLRRKAGG